MKKVPTIFVRSAEKRHLVTDEVNPVCAWVFKGEGVATRKLDGMCCKVEGGRLFKRREVKKGRAAPPGFILEEEDPNTGKSFGWVLADLDSKEDQYFREAFEDGPYADGTYELIGPKVQGGAEGPGDRHVLVRHSPENLGFSSQPPRHFFGLAEWLSGQDIEGIVWHHPDGRMAKIKKRDFGLGRSA